MDIFQKLLRPRVKPADNHSTLLESSAEISDTTKLSNIEKSDTKITSKMSEEFR